MWHNISLNNNKFFLKQEMVNNLITTTLSDMINIWIESLTEDDVIKKFNACNPMAKANNTWIIKFVTTGIMTGSSVPVLETIDIGFKLTLTGSLGLKYTFHLLKQPQETVYKELTLPLLLVINELKHRQELLYNQLEAKDIEILEYKLEGYKISRRNVITTEFKKDDFEKECNENIEGRLQKALGDIPSVMSDINTLYSDLIKVISPSTADQLRQGKLLEIKKEVSLEEPNIQQNNDVYKRTYPKEESVSIKKFKKTNKSIL